MSERIPEMLTVMTPFPYTIDVRAGISAARALMAEYDIRHLAVTEERRLIGIISRRDLDAAQTPARGAEPDEEPHPDREERARRLPPGRVMGLRQLSVHVLEGSAFEIGPRSGLDLDDHRAVEV